MTVALPKSTRRRINRAVKRTGIWYYWRDGTANIEAPKRQKRAQIQKMRRALAKAQGRKFYA